MALDIEYRKVVLNDTSASLTGVYVEDIVDTKDLTVRNSIKVTGSVSMGGDLQVFGNTGVSGTLIVSKSTTLSDLLVEKNLDVFEKGTFLKDLSTSGSLTVEKNLVVGGDFDISGSTKIDGDLDVNGSGNFEKNLTVEGNLETKGNEVIKGDTRVEGSASILENLTVAKKVFIGDSTTISGDLTVNGTITKIGTRDLTIADKLIEIASGSLTPEQADGAGIFISGANVSLTHSYVDSQFRVSEGILAEGNSKINGNLTVRDNASVTGSLWVGGDTNIKNLTGNNIGGQNLYLEGSASITNLSVGETVSASYYYGDGTSLYNVTCSIATSSMFRKEVSIDAGQGVEIRHQFNNYNVISQVYAYVGSETCSVVPPVSKILSKDTIFIGGFDTHIDGYVVVADAGHLIEGGVEFLDYTTKKFEFTSPGDGYYRDCAHSFGTENVLVGVYVVHDGITEYIVPKSIRVLNTSTVRVIFGRACTGYIVVAKGGHLVTGSISIDESSLVNAQVHRGTTGSWEANNYSINQTMSAQVVVAGKYVDTTKVGIRSNGSYTGVDWGSYTKYSDGGIEEWVCPDLGSEPQKVALFSHAGDLFITGSLYSNESWNDSDIKLKENVETIENPLKNLEKLRGVGFDWKSNNKHSFGVIAQEVQEVYPELVHRIVGMGKNEGHLVVNYQGLIGVLIESVKELSSRVKYLEGRLE